MMYIMIACICAIAAAAAAHTIIISSASFMVLFLVDAISVFAAVIALQVYDRRVKEGYFMQNHPAVFDEHIKSYWNYSQTPVIKLLDLPEIQNDNNAVAQLKKLITLRKFVLVIALCAFLSLPCGVALMLFAA